MSENRIHRAKAGTEISINIYGKYGHIKGKQKWKVVESYPYFIIAERNGKRRTFNLGDLVHLGVEKQGSRRLQRLADEVNNLSTLSRPWKESQSA